MEGLHLFPLSPTTRRRHRGRGVIVLDNVTASNLTNNPLAVNGGVATGETAVRTPELPVTGLAITATTGGGDILPTPSPDEMVIQARGRRQIPLTFSPDVHLTPTFRSKAKISNGGSLNSMNRLLLPTRTSPRKRLTLTDSPPNIGGASNNSGSTTPSPDKMKRSPISKKFKLEAVSMNSVANVEEITTSLKGLSKEQMVSLLSRVLAQHPEITEEVKCMVPAPDLTPLEERLNYLKRNIFRALPNTRLESKTDSMAYNRVATHLVAFKKAVVDQGKLLAESHQWPALIDYCIMAWSYVKATPVWDNPPHNNVRKQCFKTLAASVVQALKKGHWKVDIVSDIKIKLESCKTDSEEIVSCLKYIDQMMCSGNNGIISK